MEWIPYVMIPTVIRWIPDIIEIVLLGAIIVQVDDNKKLINKHNEDIKK